MQNSRGWWFLGALLCCGCSEMYFDIVLDSVPEGGLWSAWGPASDDIWVVGGQADEGVVLRGDRAGFTPLSLPEDTPLLNWVHGTSAEDVWVGGLYGTLLHWDGADWSDYSVDVDEAFWGLYAVSPSEVYAVGGLSGWAGRRRLAMAFDGNEWTDIPLPSELEDLTALFKVHYDGHDVWMVGAQGTALVGGPDAFERVPTGVSLDLSTVHSRGDGQVVAVGGRETGLIMMGNRVDGLVEVGQAPSRLFGVHVFGTGDVVVSGMRGYLGRFSLDEPTVVTLPSPTEQILHAVYGHDGGRVYSVGGNIGSISDDFTGIVLSAKAP